MNYIFAGFKHPLGCSEFEMKHIILSQKDFDLAYDFSREVYNKFKPIVKSIILFGSVSKGVQKPSSDVDLVILIDNVSLQWDAELIAWYREELAKLVIKDEKNKKLHVNTVTLSAFWENVLVGDPVSINVLRYGTPIIDLGFIGPLQALLFAGRIRPSPEAIWTTKNRVQWHTQRARVKYLSIIEDYYWAMVDAAHAALMSRGWSPPSPEHIPDMLSEAFVKKKRLKQRYVNSFQQAYKLAHAIKNMEITRISASRAERFKDQSEEFIKAMDKLTRKRRA